MVFTLIAQAAPAGGAGAGPALAAQILPLVAIGFIFYFLLIRPQSKRMKEHRALLEAIVRGDTVVTNGGLIGKVKKVTDDELTITIAQNTDIKVVRSMIADVRNKTKAAND